MRRFLYLENRSEGDPLARRILRSLPDCRIHEIQDHRKLWETDVPLIGYTAKMKKDVLILAHHPGPFIRPFPGSSEEDGADEFFIAHANGCLFDCKYCFLQGYFDHGAPVLFTNLEELLMELEEHLEQNAQNNPVTYHAGEYSDALALESLSGFAALTIPVFHRHPGARLELRTKCIDIENLLPERPPENVVVSWTLTPMEAWKKYEQGTPDPVQRLLSARACQGKGYRVGVRLDPALLFPGWEQAYETLVQEIFEELPPGSIESFVIGGFRTMPSLAARIRERFPACDLLGQEFVLCRDGKHRYFRPLRVRLYRKIIHEIRRHDESATIRLCMETSQVEKDVGGGMVHER